MGFAYESLSFPPLKLFIGHGLHLLLENLQPILSPCERLWGCFGSWQQVSPNERISLAKKPCTARQWDWLPLASRICGCMSWLKTKTEYGPWLLNSCQTFADGFYMSMLGDWERKFGRFVNMDSSNHITCSPWSYNFIAVILICSSKNRTSEALIERNYGTTVHAAVMLESLQHLGPGFLVADLQVTSPISQEHG